MTGKTIGEHARAAQETPGQEVVRPLDNPLKPTGGIAILRGNLAPEGCVVKLSGHERGHHEGPARVFEGEEARDGRRHARADRARATSSSSATRARPAAPACARCSPSPRRSWGRGSATPSRCSPTAASPAPRAASWSATSPPRPSTAARSRPSARATRSRSTSTNRRLDVDLPRRRDRRAASRPTSRRPPSHGNGVLAKYAKLVVERLRGRGHALTPATPRLGRPLAGEERGQQLVEARRALEHRQVPGVLEDHAVGVVADQVLELVGVRDRDQHVVAAPHDQRRAPRSARAGRGTSSPAARRSAPMKPGVPAPATSSVASGTDSRSG